MRRYGLAVVCFAVLGCGSSSSQEGDTTPQVQPPPQEPAQPPPPPPPAPVEVSVRVIHAAALAKAVPINVTHPAGQGAPGALATALAFGTASTYTSATLAPSAQSLSLSVAAEGFDPFSDSGAISAGDPHTAIVFSGADSATALGAAIVHDSAQAADSGKTRVRFFHAVVGWTELDVCAPGENARAAATPLFPASAYGQMSHPEYVDLPAGVQKVQLREAKPDAPCTGRVVGVADLAPPEGATLDAQNITLVAVGRGTGRPAIPRALLLCLDSPAAAPACASQPMRAR